MISFDKDAVMSLYDLSYGVDNVDERVKYFATYRFATNTYTVFVEVKTVEEVCFPRAVVLKDLERIGGGQLRYRFEGVIDDLGNKEEV